MFHLNFVGIPVADQDRALKFYTEKLGCKRLQDVPMGPMRWIMVEPPGGGASLVLFTPPGHEDRVGTILHMGLTADDVESTCRVLMERGVEFVEPPQRADWGGIQAIFKDSEGNSIVIARQ